MISIGSLGVVSLISLFKFNAGEANDFNSEDETESNQERYHKSNQISKCKRSVSKPLGKTTVKFLTSRNSE